MNRSHRPHLGMVADILGSLDADYSDYEGVKRLRILTRHPDRWGHVQPTGWSIDVSWCSPRPGQGRIPYRPDAVVQDMMENESKATAYVLDVLDINGPGVDDVSNWLLMLDDCSTAVDTTIYVCVDEGLHAPADLARWGTILPRLDVASDAFQQAGEPTFEPTKTASIGTGEDTPQSEAGVHEIQHLTRLPTGFSTEALRRRILQWRRMGFDVSDLESALVQDAHVREQIYRHVEDCVRRAIDLNRRLTMMAEHLPATDVERDRFRLRQLTGLDQIESSLNALTE